MPMDLAMRSDQDAIGNALINHYDITNCVFYETKYKTFKRC